MNIMEICKMIQMPEEAMALIKEAEEKIDFHELEVEIAQMKQSESWETALSGLKQRFEPDENNIKILTCQLFCLCDTYDRYKKLGIEDEMFIDTMKFFSRFLIDFKTKHGAYCYVWAWWAVRQISMVEFRIGALEYEMRLEQNRKVIDIHIPGDADLRKESLRKSYVDAVKFFQTYFPDFQYEEMVCSSWLLAPTLKELLDKDSKIIGFQEAFEVIFVEEDSMGFMDWIYDKKDIPLEELPENTSLQKKLKPFLLNKGKVGWTSGKLKENPFL